MKGGLALFSSLGMGSFVVRKCRLLALIFSIFSLALTGLTFLTPIFEAQGERPGIITLWKYDMEDINESADGGEEENINNSNSINKNGTSRATRADDSVGKRKKDQPHENEAGDTDDIILYEDYFTCNYGRFHIQVVEGLSIVAASLNFMNFFMCIFFFGTHSFLRVPLVTYFLLAACCSGVVFGLLLDWYKNEWCDSQPCLSCLEEDGWQLGYGWMFLVASSSFSFVGAVTAIISS